MKNNIPMREHIRAAVTMALWFVMAAGAEGLADLILGVM